jgi:hypothetical protein
MKKLHPVLLSLACCMGVAAGQTEELKDYVLPLPDRFVEFVDETLSDRGQDLQSIFRTNGIVIPAGGKIEINRTAGALDAKLPQKEALNVIELLNYCITQSTARFFRPCFPVPPAVAEGNAKEALPIPETHAGQKEISIHAEAPTGDKMTCLLVNPADHPIWYSPAYRIQVLADGKWSEHPILWDCDGGSTQQLPPQRACRLTVEMPNIGPPMRVGVSLLDDVSIQRLHNTVWSDPIKLK